MFTLRPLSGILLCIECAAAEESGEERRYECDECGERNNPVVAAGLAARVRVRGVRILLLISFLCGTGEAQSISVGVTGGGRVTDDVAYSAVPESRRYVVGPMVELGLPFGLAVEVDALYHRQGYQVSNGNFAGFVVQSERGNSWEFPVLLKYKLPVAKINPFAEVGLAPRVISGNIAESGASINVTTGVSTPFSDTVKTNFDASYGFVAGGGVQFDIGRLRLSPEVRYTHWMSTPIYGYFGDGPSYSSTQNQADVLVGIGWKLN